MVDEVVAGPPKSWSRRPRQALATVDAEATVAECVPVAVTAAEGVAAAPTVAAAAGEALAAAFKVVAGASAAVSVAAVVGLGRGGPLTLRTRLWYWPQRPAAVDCGNQYCNSAAEVGRCRCWGAWRRRSAGQGSDGGGCGHGHGGGGSVYGGGRRSRSWLRNEDVSTEVMVVTEVAAAAEVAATTAEAVGTVAMVAASAEAHVTVVEIGAVAAKVCSRNFRHRSCSDQGTVSTEQGTCCDCQRCGHGS